MQFYIIAHPSIIQPTDIVELHKREISKIGQRIIKGHFADIINYSSSYDIILHEWSPYPYMGCGRLGNCLCLKLNLQDILYEKCSHGILLYQDTVHHYKEINKVAFCSALNEYSKLSELNKLLQLAWFIVEMHHREPQPYAVMDYIYDHNPFTDLDMYILPHASLLKQQVRVTLFGLY